MAQEKIGYVSEQIVRLTEEIEQDRAQFENINKELLSLRDQKQQESSNLNLLHSQADETQNIYNQVVEELSKLEAKADSSQKQILSEIDKISNIKANATKLEEQKNSCNERQSELTARKENSLKKLETLKLSESEAKLDKEKAEAEQKNLILSIKALQENNIELKEEERAQQNTLSELLKQQASLESRSKMLAEMHAEYEGFNGTVKKLLVDSDKNIKLKNAIVGVVADLIKVPKEYETAIEMALGSAVQNVVTKNEDDAKQLVQYLKANSYGRATFLPISSLKAKYIQDSFKPLLKTSTPITAVRTISSLVQSFIALIIPIRLMAAGLTQGEALAEFGIATGMTLPLLMVPCTLISSIAVAFVPEISGQTDNIDKQPPRELAKLKTHINLCVNVSIVIAFILFPAFAAIGMPIGEALFHNEKAGYYLMLSAIVMLPICLSQITSSILNSLGLEMKSLINYAIGAILLFLSIFFLPKWIGAVSLIVGLGSLYFVTTILNLVMLHKRNLLSFTYVKNILLLFVVSIPCILFTKWFYLILSRYMSLFISTAIAGAVSVGLFVSICAIFNLANFRIILFRKRKVAKATA